MIHCKDTERGWIWLIQKWFNTLTWLLNRQHTRWKVAFTHEWSTSDVGDQLGPRGFGFCVETVASVVMIWIWTCLRGWIFSCWTWKPWEKLQPPSGSAEEFSLNTASVTGLICRVEHWFKQRSNVPSLILLKPTQTKNTVVPQDKHFNRKMRPCVVKSV